MCVGEIVRSMQLLIPLAAVSLDAAQFLVVTRPAGAVWTVSEAEEILINGKEKVRSSAIESNRPPTWDARTAGRLPETALASFSIIRRAPDGNVWAQVAASGAWILLLPQGIKAKAPQSAASCWGAAAITVRRQRGDKAGVAIRADELYAILPGLDPAGSAARLATEAGLHKAPGLDDTQALRNLTELIPAVAKTFPSGTAAEKVRDTLRIELQDHLQRWIGGDALRTVMDEGLMLAAASEAAFPQDSAQKRLRDRIRGAQQRLDRRVAILRALDLSGRPDAFLVAYREFEPYDRSFPELAAARRRNLEASAVGHLAAAERLRRSGDYVGAIRHLRIARLRRPDIPNGARLLEQVRLEVARLSSQQFAELRRGIDPRSPKRVQVERRLRIAEQYIRDSKANEAEKALDEAEAIDKDEPRTKLVEVRLAVLRGDLGMALALLDLYAGMATTTADFAEGEKLRGEVLYQIETQRNQIHTRLKSLYAGQRFATALTTSAEALKLDNEDPEFLYYAGVDACLLRHCADAAPLLNRFLELTDSTAGSRNQRIAAVRLLQQPGEPREAERLRTAGIERSWFSGEPLERGVFYDPISLAFQPKVAHIAVSGHLSVDYQWKDNRLASVHTRLEEKKTAGNVARLALGVGMAAGAGAGSVLWKTPERETNDFYFNYYDDVPQVFNVNRDNQVIKSRTIPIMIPGLGGFGAFAGLASLGRVGGLSGAGSWSGLLATASALQRPGGWVGLAGGEGGLPGAVAGLLPAPRYSIQGDPQGGASSGYLALWNNPRLDTSLAYRVTGKHLAVGFSGNHYFHPFAWDGLHLFELDYDSEGRVRHAWELDQPNAPRLDFAWDGHRLLSVTARENTPAGTVVYSRVLRYSENRLLEESITTGGKTAHIHYRYDKRGRLVEAECSDDPSLDGRSRKVEFLSESAERGRS